ncbi:MAG: hypothetical protein ACE5FT_00825 [Candidatus Nanoarchaeia archaeon]
MTVEILFYGGKARELQKPDVLTLAEMCDEDILRYNFSSGNKSMSLYWSYQLAEQRKWEWKINYKRSRYVLSIEQDEEVKGCVTLEAEINSRKRRYKNPIVRRRCPPKCNNDIRFLKMCHDELILCIL